MQGDKKKDQLGTSAEARAKADLDKYMWYYQRYHNHDQVGV